ncbi:2160_t:CDS:2 [Rhizophagus irregularis]|nr:2160_t:CDS:2 [Rhizophagus irregularis]
MSSKPTNPDKMKCLYQYAIKRGEKNPEKFSIITGAEKNKWDNECFRNVLEKDMRFYRGAVETL